MRRRPQRLNGVHRATVAAERYHRPVGLGKLDPDRLRQGDADAAATHAEPAIGRHRRHQVANGVHAGRQGFLDDDGVGRQALGNRMQHGERAKRQDVGLCLGASDERSPLGREVGGDRRCAPCCRGHAGEDGGGQVGQRRGRITQDRGGDGEVLADLPGVVVHMDQWLAGSQRLDTSSLGLRQ